MKTRFINFYCYLYINIDFCWILNKLKFLRHFLNKKGKEFLWEMIHGTSRCWSWFGKYLWRIFFLISYCILIGASFRSFVLWHLRKLNIHFLTKFMMKWNLIEILFSRERNLWNSSNRLKVQFSFRIGFFWNLFDILMSEWVIEWRF